MNVQINKQGGVLKIKSTIKKTKVFNLQCVLYQQSVLAHGMDYTMSMRDVSRSNKEYNSWEKKAKRYSDVWNRLERAMNSMYPSITGETKLGEFYILNTSVFSKRKEGNVMFQ